MHEHIEMEEMLNEEKETETRFSSPEPNEKTGMNKRNVKPILTPKTLVKEEKSRMKKKRIEERGENEDSSTKPEKKGTQTHTMNPSNDIGEGLVPDVLDDSHSCEHEKLCAHSAQSMLLGKSEPLMRKDILLMISSLELSPQGKIPLVLSHEGLGVKSNPHGSTEIKREVGFIYNHGIVVEQTDEQIFNEVYDAATVATNLAYVDMMPPEVSIIESTYLRFADKHVQPRFKDDPNNILCNSPLITAYDEPEEES